MASGEDVTERRRTEQQVTHLAHHDALNGLQPHAARGAFQSRSRARPLAPPGGDELLLLFADRHGDPMVVAEQTAARIIAARQEPFSIGGAEFQVGCSIDISLHLCDARDADELLDQADWAMYRAKTVARGCWAIYARKHESPMERLSLATRLRRA